MKMNAAWLLCCFWAVFAWRVSGLAVRDSMSPMRARTRGAKMPISVKTKVVLRQGEIKLRPQSAPPRPQLFLRTARRTTTAAPCVAGNEKIKKTTEGAKKLITKTAARTKKDPPRRVTRKYRAAVYYPPPPDMPKFAPPPDPCKPCAKKGTTKTTTKRPLCTTATTTTATTTTITSTTRTTSTLTKKATTMVTSLTTLATTTVTTATTVTTTATTSTATTLATTVTTLQSTIAGTTAKAAPPTTTTTTTTTTTLQAKLQCVQTATFSCSAEAKQSSWEKVCITNSIRCSGCQWCVNLGMVTCESGWLSWGGHCYKVNTGQELDFYQSDKWCKDKSSSARLISINNLQENNFTHRICHDDNNAILYPKITSRTVCWIGLSEKYGTGSVSTPQASQKWDWLDGTNITTGYKNWAKIATHVPEPNNQRTSSSTGMDVRHAVMNSADDKNGFWFDMPAQFRARAICEYVPKNSSSF